MESTTGKKILIAALLTVLLVASVIFLQLFRSSENRAGDTLPLLQVSGTDIITDTRAKVHLRGIADGYSTITATYRMDAICESLQSMSQRA